MKLPTPERAAALMATLHVCNEAANRLSARASEHGRTSRAALQASAYAELKARGLSAQPALHALRKVADAYSTLRPSRTNRRAAEPVAFRPGAAQPFDDRCLSWQLDDRTVSIRTVSGRMKAGSAGATGEIRAANPGTDSFPE
ncbi:hypothetical protein ABZY16_31630 [Streptomyces sp. NPDC006553]|uniref:hypothetical protein n=1 Tax=Streptomyces sp. NPDC006553 TaxID=3157180 RepID=UPI0033ADDCE3